MISKNCIKKIIEREDVLYYLSKAKEINNCIEAKSYTIEEEKYHKKQLDELITEIQACLK